MDASTIVNLGLLLVTALGVAAAAWQANEARVARRETQQAQTETEQARDEAVRLSKEATAAFVRQAAAQEEANELRRAAMPKDRVTWSIRPVRNSKYEVVNMGNIPARAVHVTGGGAAPGFIHVDGEEEALPRDVLPGDGVAFVVFRASGPDPVLRVEWRLDNDEEFYFERAIR